MNEENKIEKFKEPLGYIKNGEIYLFAYMAVMLLPDYFFEIPASSSGKYHPEYAVGEGGLFRHTLSAVRIAVELSTLEQFKLTEDEKDMAIVALMLHDGWKSGLENGKNTVHDHPIVAVNVLKSNDLLMHVLNSERSTKIFDAMLSHMGQWTKSKHSKVTLRKPKSRLDKFVHLCDYLASRKSIHMFFDVAIERR